MTKTTKKITKAEVQAELRKIKRENPDAVNPTRVDQFGNTSCLYHQGRGANIKRCIIGQMGWNMGLPTPSDMEGPAIDVAYDGTWAGRFTEAAADYMWRIQQQADGDSDPVPWGQVKL